MRCVYNKWWKLNIALSRNYIENKTSENDVKYEYVVIVSKWNWIRIVWNILGVSIQYSLESLKLLVITLDVPLSHKRETDLIVDLKLFWLCEPCNR